VNPTPSRRLDFARPLGKADGMIRDFLLLGLALAAPLAVACTTPANPADPTTVATAAPATASAVAATDAKPTASTKPSHEPPAHAAPVGTFGDPPPAAGGDYEITFDDCSRLCDNFERRLREDEEGKLQAQKLEGKALEKAKAIVDEVVQKGLENWRGQCRTIVGTVQVRSRIRCAIAADSLARFNGCWDGQFDAE
jgi:hypothetical protein